MKERVFITRKYAPESTQFLICDESVFRSYEKAYAYLEYILEDENDAFIGEIVEFELDSTESIIDSWCFDNKGQLLDCFYDPSKYLDPQSYQGLYLPGDIVFIRANPWNKNGSQHDIIGVVGFTPVPYDLWMSKDNEDNKDWDWDNRYTIYFICNGYMDLFHAPEDAVKPYTDDIPKSDTFLIRLSQHFKGTRLISDDLFRKLLECSVFVGKVNFIGEEEF